MADNNKGLLTQNGVHLQKYEYATVKLLLKHTIKHTFQNAVHQSGNAIIALRRCGLPEEKSIETLEQEFSLFKRIRRMKIELKSGDILDYLK